MKKEKTRSRLVFIFCSVLFSAIREQRNIIKPRDESADVNNQLIKFITRNGRY